MKAQAYYELVAPFVRNYCFKKGYGYPSFVICLAQAACETGFGKSQIMMDNHALFGVKATKEQIAQGKYYEAMTTEYYNGKATRVKAKFASYDSFEESAERYFKLIEGKRYNASLKATTPTECITIIKNGGYATSPTYVSTIINNFYLPYKDIIDKLWNAVPTTSEVADVKITETEVVNYKIVGGDNLTKISKKFCTPIDTIVTWNKAKYPRMTRNYIQAGWTIRVK